MPLNTKYDSHHTTETPHTTNTTPHAIGNEMIAPLDVCPSWERRLPFKTFARQSFARHGRLPVKTEKMLEVRTGKLLYIIMQ